MPETLGSSEPSMASVEPIDVSDIRPVPGTQSSKSSPLSNHDSENSDSDSDDEARDDLEIRNLESELSSNPSNYDAHVQYIKAIRKTGDIDKLRQAREAMSNLFPLSPAMWQEWIKDEILFGSGPDAYVAIEKLYDRAVHDYLSVPLWCDYVKFIQDYDPDIRQYSPDGIVKVRELFERALAAAGLHVVEGTKLWEAYRKCEEEIFGTATEANVDKREKQVQRIQSIFHRQLSVPHQDLKSTLLSYKAWEAAHGNNLDVNSSSMDGIPSQVASAYQKALEMLSARAAFEDQILRHDLSDTERLQQFMGYLKFEQSAGDPSRVQSLYERAITEFPISTELWLDYTQYLVKTLKIDRVVGDVYNRATKNCPWVGELWVRYLLLLERSHASETEICGVFEKALLCTFSTFDEYLDVFLTRVDGLRRRLVFAGDLDALDYALIRDTFQRASDYLSPHMKNTESLLRMHSYWARLESSLGNDLSASRGVWESFLKNSGSMLEAWQAYIVMEIELGHLNEARSLYKRCYSKRFSGTGSEDICHSWVRFEREFGTLEDYEHALKKVTPRLQELQLFRLQQESQTSSTGKKEESLKKNVREKRKPVSDISDEQTPVKRQKDATQISGDTIRKMDVRERRGKPGHIDDNKAKAANPEKPIRHTDQCTAFISNLSLQATDEDLHSFFSDVGGVTGMRILTDRVTKKPRGLAYVDFLDDEHLVAAVAKNKQTLLGKKLSIARSDPKGKKRDFAGHSTSKQQGQDGSKDSNATSGGGRRPKAESTDQKVGDDTIQLRGKNTFAVPRNVRPLGWTDRKTPKSNSLEAEAEKPKSNDEFRNMLLKKI